MNPSTFSRFCRILVFRISPTSCRLINIDFYHTSLLVIPGNWGPWSGWHSCSAACNGGIRNRTRRCNNPPPALSNGQSRCEGDSIEKERCNTDPCPQISQYFYECLQTTVYHFINSYLLVIFEILLLYSTYQTPVPVYTSISSL